MWLFVRPQPKAGKRGFSVTTSIPFSQGEYFLFDFKFPSDINERYVWVSRKEQEPRQSGSAKWLLHNETSYVCEWMGQTISRPSRWLHWWTRPVIPTSYWLDMFLLDCYMAEMGWRARLDGVRAQRPTTETSVAHYDRLRVKMKTSCCVMGCSNWGLVQNTCKKGQIL